MSTANSSVLTTAAGENIRVTPLDGFPGRPGNSTIRWGGGLLAHPEVHEHEVDSTHKQDYTEPLPRKPITPSLATLEKAVSARIYFENLYFPLLRQPPSREQRRLAMEQDMVELRLSEVQKENLRARWRQNETDYLRDRRRKVDVSAFVKLKTIGHGLPYQPCPRNIFRLILPNTGAFGVVSLVKEQYTGKLYAMKQVICFIHFAPRQSLIDTPCSCARQICYVKGKRGMFARSETSSNRHLSSARPVELNGLCDSTTASRTVIIFTWSATIMRYFPLEQ